ncbi:MAG: aspartyl/glutamyl-tRNA amidotransferase subunit C [Candidatus Yonathbacteria bacterium]|nr:aspartyl/glutamyl-tRNA amidotransferase subunit C [Candidatus Yonathbacteria bacterium]
MDTEAMKKLALLCRIDMADDELETLRGEMEHILGYVEKVGELAPEKRAFDAGVHRNVLREDVFPHESGTYTEALLSAAPSRDGYFIRVKKVL